MNYRLAYWLGFHPWEDAASDAQFAAKISELFEREESGREPPYGQALDIGTGSGIWGIELAKRGWQVTGIDIVDKALRRGRDRALEAGVQMGFVQGDVTALERADIDGGVRLVLDTGTFHDFDDAQRKAMGRGVTAVAAPDATVLLLVWPKRRRPLIRGANRDEVQEAFPDWTITHVEPSHFRLPKPLQLLLRPDEHWYRLRRMSDDLRAELAQQIHRVDWKPLAPHAKRGGLVIVDPQLDLLEVAVAVARDHGEQVQQWMAAQQLRRATAAEVEVWREEIGERFTVVIVQPYVLAQRDEVDSVKVE